MLEVMLADSLKLGATRYLSISNLTQPLKTFSRNLICLNFQHIVAHIPRLDDPSDRTSLKLL